MAEERVQRKLAAILAADVVGYSRLTENDEEGTLARLKLVREELINPTIAAHRGHTVKLMGDGALVEFMSAVDAVRCAIDIQRRVVERNVALPAEQRIEFRIGINLGDIVIDGDDILGDGVNVAARLEGLCGPGEVYLSGTIYDHVEGKLAANFDDLGEQKVKNIIKPIRIYRARYTISDKAMQGRVGSALSMRHVPSIAVLPFQNMSGDPEQEYFADGLTEDIITALSVWRSFPVIARNSTFTYKGRAVNVQQIAQELRAGYVLEGSVRKREHRVRITAQLIDAESGNHVWAQKFDRHIEDIFEVQDEITHRIAATVVPELEKVETKRSAAKQPRNLDAWDCYHRGLSFLHESTIEGNVRAHEMFERALEQDPAYGPAFTGMAYILNRDLVLDYAESFDDTVAKCLETAKRAVELDESASISRTELVRALLWSGQHDAAIAEANKAIEQNPYNALAQFWLGAAFAFAGREEEAIPRLEHALELTPRDPRNQFFMTHLALAYLSTGQPERALEWVRLAALRRSDFIEAPLTLVSILAHLGKEEEAKAALDRIAVADLGSVERRPHWRRYRHPTTKELVLDGLRKAGLPE
jgi:adenylate cyclase